MENCRRRISEEIEDRKTLRTANSVCTQLSLMDLPIAVLFEILFKLPIASLMKVKLVCTSLYKLVTDPNFCISYSKNSTYESFFMPSKRDVSLVLLEISENSEIVQTTFTPKIRSWLLEMPFLFPRDTCNGLLCCSLRHSGTETAYICNPIIGECIKLPEIRDTMFCNISAEYGLGFCKSTNNYKVFRFVCELGLLSHKGKGYIFTIGVNNRWRELPDAFLASSCSSDKMVTINGGFHWLVNYDRYSWIFTFDIEEEKYGDISPPNGMELSIVWMKLTSIHDQLCLVDSHDHSVIVIWKMKEYGVAESWIKDVIFNLTSPWEHSMTLYTVRISRNGDILLSHQYENHATSYNPVKKKRHTIMVSLRGSVAYAPSFWSLKEVMKERDLGTIKVNRHLF